MDSIKIIQEKLYWILIRISQIKYIEEIQKDMIKGIGKQNIFYCFCGSGLKYDECCHRKPIKDCRYTKPELTKFFLEWENIIEKNDISEKYKYKSGALTGLYQQLEKFGRLYDFCIAPGCENKQIGSHLFPRNFIDILQKEGYKFNIEGISKTLGANSFKMNLWCCNHDKELFKGTDILSDISKVFDSSEKQINRDQLIGEFYLKTLSFKVKTIILDQMFLFIGMLFVSNENESLKKTIYDKFINGYIIYDKLLKSFDSLFVTSNDGNRTINFPYLEGRFLKVIDVYDEDYVYYQSNIKIIGSTSIFVINIIKEGNRMYFVGSTVLGGLDDEGRKTLEKIYNKLGFFKTNNDLKGATSYLEQIFFKENNIYYLNISGGFSGNTYIFGSRK